MLSKFGLLVLASILPLSAQWENLKGGDTNLKAPAPRRADGKPDLTGIWIADPPKLRDVTLDLKPGELQMQEWAEAVYNQRKTGDLSADDPDANCLPQGVPKIDGRALPRDPNPQWFGYSIARWELDTLVVESSGFNGKAWLDQVGHPSTEKLRVTERFRRRDFGHMDVISTIDDPGAYKKPWTFTQPLTLLPATELLELVCNENNKDIPHLKGK